MAICGLANGFSTQSKSLSVVLKSHQLRASYLGKAGPGQYGDQDRVDSLEGSLKSQGTGRVRVHFFHWLSLEDLAYSGAATPHTLGDT